MDAKTIIKRYQLRKSERTNLDSIWELIEQFIAPFRADLFSSLSSEGSIDWKKRELYDSTAVSANANLAAHIHGALTNPFIKWFKHDYKQTTVKENQEAKEWLEEADWINWQSLQESPFANEANEYYLDLTSFGTAAMMSEPEENSVGDLDSIDYKDIPIDECYFDLDVKGRTVNFYRKLEWTADQIVEKFGKEKIPDKIKQEFEREHRGDIRHMVIFCIFKRDTILDFNPWTVVKPELRPYGSKYIFEADKSVLGEEGGHYEQPVFRSVWRRVSGSQWGFSPSMIAIWDVLSLNQMDELIMIAGEKVLDPTLLLTRKGVFGDIDLSAGGTVVVQDVEKSMKAFESRARFDVSAMGKSDLIRAIERIYFVNELQLKESPAMTATEVNARVQLMQRLLGPTFGYLRTDFLDPAIERNFRINYRYRKFPPLPPVLAETQADLEIQYLGQLARAQRAEETNAIERVVGTAAQMEETFPGTVDNIDADASIRAISESEGAPARMMKGKLEVQQERQQRAKAEQAKQAVAMQAAQGEADSQTGQGMQAITEAQGATMN